MPRDEIAGYCCGGGGMVSAWNADVRDGAGVRASGKTACGKTQKNDERRIDNGICNSYIKD